MRSLVARCSLRLIVSTCLLLLMLLTVYIVTSSYHTKQHDRGKPNKDDVISTSGFDISPDQFNDELTVVTAFLNIGKFAKGAQHGPFFTPDLYRTWMTSFALIDNPLIVFIDNKADLAYFRAIRRRLPANRTSLVLVSRSRMWTFSNETVSRVRRIFNQAKYPRHYPNTVVPEYSLAMHAKYEVMQMAVRENPFKTRYFCWLDIGLFRDITPPPLNQTNSTVLSELTFSLYLPPNFTSDSVAVCEIYTRMPTLTPRDIVYGNHVWIGGGFFVGRADIVYKWTVEYLDAVRWMMRDQLLSTDQQVIYSMFNAALLGLRYEPKTKLTVYRGDGRFNEWFHLAYIAREQGIARKRSMSNKHL